MSERPIVFLSDFGTGDEWVGICHAVIARIAPQSRVVDLSHEIHALNVAAGARLLADSVPYLPQDAVVLAVVDPNVGKDREVAVEVEGGRTLVGPDNGLLSLAWEVDGGVTAAVEITSDEVIVQPISQSFRARDTLAPATAHLASGLALADLGSPLDPATLQRLALTEPEGSPGKLHCEVVDSNRFGNVQLNAREEHLSAAGLDDAQWLEIVTLGKTTRARRGKTYADFARGDYGLIVDHRGWLTIVRANPWRALEDLDLAIGDPVWINAGSG